MLNPSLVKTMAIIPAAGSGIRMESKRAKQFLSLDGKPILALTLEPFQECSDVAAVILVVPPDDVEYCKKEIVERFGFTKVKKIVPGGKRRQDSVRLGLEAAEGKYDLVLIHDGVRPLIEKGLIERVIEEAITNRAVITALPAKETVKEVNDLRDVVKTYDRERVWMVQTPQAFRYQDILKAHQNALKEGWEEVTDDALLVERSGITVKVVEGSEKNIKVTTPHDLKLARFLLRS
ncbi:MAG: 2-C-methyl-D-erythritol 4-phosphate cytidylyltransferase [Desulfobacteraceae bacterium]|nr:2-C-methyl-D-erythritol 4-phosphate cytidylyltransferase [Desulfobacteraceae bacterium]